MASNKRAAEAAPGQGVSKKARKAAAVEGEGKRGAEEDGEGKKKNKKNKKKKKEGEAKGGKGEKEGGHKGGAGGDEGKRGVEEDGEVKKKKKKKKKEGEAEEGGGEEEEDETMKAKKKSKKKETEEGEAEEGGGEGKKKKKKKKSKKKEAEEGGGEEEEKEEKSKKNSEEGKVAVLTPSPSAGLPPPRRALPPHQLVMAPMVGGSELAYRLLARRHGAQLCYTPMMHADRFATDKAYRAAELQTLPADAPLVAHFCGNDAKVMLAAARLAEPHCVAVDINLGCPQRAAHSGCYGSFCRRDDDASGELDTGLVLGIVSTMARGLKVPLFCKVRLMDELADTVLFCQQLQEAGCALLAVHGRYRGSPTHRREGAAHLDQVAAVKAALSIPVLSNGNVSSAADLLAALDETKCDGVMSAEGALDDPAIFGRAATLAEQRRREWRDLEARGKAAKAAAAAAGRGLSLGEARAVVEGKEAKKKRKALPVFEAVAGGGAGGDLPSGPLDLAEQYLELAKVHRPTLECLLFHLRRITRTELLQYELRDALEEMGGRASDVPERIRKFAVTDVKLRDAGQLMSTLREYAEGRRAFTPAAVVAAPTAAEAAAAAAVATARVASAAARAKAAAAAAGGDAKKRAEAAAACAAKRANFEQMQRKKAKRKGLSEDHFLLQGRAPPSQADVAKVKGMGEEERMEFWRGKYGQHCIMHHVSGQCEVALAWGCGFLHEDAV